MSAKLTVLAALFTLAFGVCHAQAVSDRLLSQNGDEDFCTVAELFDEYGDLLMADRLLGRRRNSPGCLDSKAQIEAARNHRTHAQSLVESTIDAPRPPEPHYRYGLFLVSNQEADGARREFVLALVYRPHWAAGQR